MQCSQSMEGGEERLDDVKAQLQSAMRDLEYYVKEFVLYFGCRRKQQVFLVQINK